MKYLKMLGLAAVAAAALMAFASPAGATTLTSPTGVVVPAGTTIHAVSEGHAVLDSLIGKIECNSTVQGKTDNAHGHTITGAIAILSFEPCTTAVVKTLTNGTLSITAESGNKGDLFSTNAEVTVETFGLHCIFKTNNTTIGTVTGSPTDSTHATLDISATIPRTGGRSGAFCGSSAPWTGSYTVTSPKPLFIDV